MLAKGENYLYVFHPSPEPRMARRLSVHSVGHFIYTREVKRQPKEGWPRHFILATLEGRAELKVRSGNHIATTGSLWFLPAQHPFYYHSLSDDWQGIWVEYEGEWADEIHEMLALDQGVKALSSQGCCDQIFQFIQLFKKGGNAALSQCNALLWPFIHSLHQAEIKNGAAGMPSKAFDQVKTRMQKQLAKPLDLAEIASWAHMSPFHFSRKFKQETGYSPMQYLRRLRIHRACDLLHQNAQSIALVGEAVGIPQPQQFSALFKEIMGASPRAYLKELGKWR